MTERQLSGMFCDDIRDEIHGKKSLIGCYQNFMEVAAFPVTLLKLCAHVRLLTPVSEPFQVLTLKILKDDEELASGTMDCALLENFSSDGTHESASDGAVQCIHVQFILSPITFEGPCNLRVRAQTENGELRGLGLVIKGSNVSD